MKSRYCIVLLVLSFFISYEGVCQSEVSKIDSLETLVSEKNGEDKAEIHRLLSVSYYDISNFRQSLDHSFKALDFYEKNDLDSHAMHIHIILGAVYESIRKYDRAEEHTLMAYEKFKKYKHHNGTIAMAMNLGVLYESMDEIEKSVHYSLEAIEKAKELGDSSRLVRIYNNISYVYLMNEEYDKSIQAIDSGIYYLEVTSNILNYEIRKNALYNNLSENYIKLKRYKEVYPILMNLDKNSEDLNLKESRDVYRMLSILHEHRGEYKKANSYLKKEQAFKDSLNSIINDEKLMELTINNEVKYKDQENELLSKKNQLISKEKEIAELKLQDQESKNNLMKIAILLTIIILVIITFNYFRTRKKNKQLVETNLEMLSKHEKVLYELTLKNTEKKLQPKENKTSDLSTEQKQEIIDALNIAFNEKEVFKNEDLTTNSLAKDLNTNRNYLSQVIKEITPTGFLDFVNEYRIRKSWILLSNPENFNLTIEHISKEVGFKSQPTFNKAFKKFTGVTPSFYLKEVKSKIQK